MSELAMRVFNGLLDFPRDRVSLIVLGLLNIGLILPEGIVQSCILLDGTFAIDGVALREGTLLFCFKEGACLVALSEERFCPLST